MSGSSEATLYPSTSMSNQHLKYEIFHNVVSTGSKASNEVCKFCYFKYLGSAKDQSGRIDVEINKVQGIKNVLE